MVQKLSNNDGGTGYSESINRSFRNDAFRYCIHYNAYHIEQDIHRIFGRLF